jgi:hypothetical protein
MDKTKHPTKGGEKEGFKSLLERSKLNYRLFLDITNQMLTMMSLFHDTPSVHL